MAKFYVTFTNQKDQTMSRVGKAPIAIPAGVTVSVSADNTVTVK